MAVVRERLQTHHPEEIKQCYYRNSSTRKTKVKAWTNSLIAELQSIAYLLPFYLCTVVLMTEGKRGLRTKTILSGYINH